MIDRTQALSRRRSLVAALTLLALTALALAARPSDEATSPGYVCAPCGCGNDEHVYSEPGLCPVCGMSLVPAPAAVVDALAPAEWLADLEYLVNRIETVHPDPFFRIPRERFYADRDRLAGAIPRLDREQIVVGMMRLLASIRDGHSSLDPVGPAAGFDRWFPIRIDEFEEGLFLAAVPRDRPELLGARVERIGDRPAAEAWALAAELAEGDNRMSRMYRTSVVTSQANLLRGLGILDQVERLPLEVTLPDGARHSVEIPSLEMPWSLHWFWAARGVPGNVDWVDIHNTLGDRLAPAYRRDRGIRWLERLPEADALYAKLDFVLDGSQGSLADFFERMFRELDAGGTQNLVLDLRDNPGGNNRLLAPLIEGIVARPELNRRGRLFVITGRRTYSAAMDCVNLLREHTRALFVGEPAGGAPISHGDSQLQRLPNSGMTFGLSVYRWDLGSLPWDQQRMVTPQLPVAVRAEDYFAGRDRALEAIRDFATHRPLADLLAERYADGGLEAAWSAFEVYKSERPDRGWWTSQPDLLEWVSSLEDSRPDPGAATAEIIPALERVVGHYPDSLEARLWLGISQMNAGRTPDARASFQAAVRIDPANRFARRLAAATEPSGHQGL